MLVLPLQLFQDGLWCTLMIVAPWPYILNPILFPNPNFEKILIEDTTKIAYEINKLRLQTREALHIKIKNLKSIELILKIATSFKVPLFFVFFKYFLYLDNLLFPLIAFPF